MLEKYDLHAGQLIKGKAIFRYECVCLQIYYSISLQPTHYLTENTNTKLGHEILQITNAAEGEEKKEPSYIVGGNVNWYSLMENSMEVP